MCLFRLFLFNNRFNYGVLNSGPALPAGDHQKIKKWSTTKHFNLIVVDSKLEEEKLFVKVHYTDKEWSSPCFDEWREACEIVDIPSCYTDNSEEGKAFFLEQLKSTIKENLHGQRKVDTVVNIELPIARNLFLELSSLGNFVGKQYRVGISALDSILGEAWHWRIFNCQ